MNHFPVLLLRNLHAPCASQARVCVCVARSCRSVVVQENDLRATPVQCNFKQTLSSHFTLQSSHFTLHTCTSFQLISSELFSYYFMSSHMSAKFFLAIFMSFERSSTFLISPKLVSIHLGSSARQKVRKLKTQMHLHRSIFTKYLSTTRLAQSTSQYYFVLQSLHKILPSTTLYHKACTKHFPALVSQYYFVL